MKMSTSSPDNLQSSNGMRMCVCVCGQNELAVCTMLAYPYQFILCYASVYTQTHTHTLASSYHLRTANQQSKTWILPLYECVSVFGENV